MKGNTKRHANGAITETVRRHGGRGQHLEQAPTQADRSQPTPRHVPWHVIARRRARNRMARRTRKRQRR